MSAGSALPAVAVFLGGVVLVVWATERLVHGLVGIGTLLRVAPFAVSAVLGGMEAEKVALGPVFGGSIVLVCAALGLGALIAPLRVRLPRGVLVTFAVAPVLAGLPLAFGGTTPRWTGAVLLLAFGAAMGYVVRASRTHRFIDDDEVEEARERPATPLRAIVL